MPLGLFRLRNVATANVVGVLWAAAMFAWFFISALYMQLVLGYDPLQVGLAFLPSNLIMGAFSLGLSAKMVMRFGIRAPLAAGLLLAAAGLALFALSPVDGSFIAHVLPGMTLLGLGAGMAFNPVLLAAMSDVAPSDSGLASGLVNTSFMMGGALGLAILASLAAARTEGLLAAGAVELVARNGGYQLAFALGAGFAAGAALLGGLLLRQKRQEDGSEAEDMGGVRVAELDVAEPVAPGALVVSLGVDTFERDPISRFKLRSEDYLRIGEMVAGLNRPTLFIMEGGYAVEEIGLNAVNVLTGFEGRTA
jgi:MFS family permease